MVAGKGRWRGGYQGQAGGWTATACSHAAASCTGFRAARPTRQTLCPPTPSTSPGQQANLEHLRTKRLTVQSCPHTMRLSHKHLVICSEVAVPVLRGLHSCRCHFETGEAQAQEFNLIELAAGVFGRSRRLIFKASSMEECCEWAIVLREAIAESSRK